MLEAARAIAVVVWTAMLVVKKGEAMRRLTKGVLPALVVVGLLAIFAALEPDLSAAVYFLGAKISSRVKGPGMFGVVTGQASSWFKKTFKRGKTD